MICALDFVALESEQPVYFGEEGVWIPLEVLIKVREIFLKEVEFILGDGLEDVLVIVGEEEELSAATTLPLHQVEHLLGVIVELEGRKNTAQVVIFEQLLEDLWSVDGHVAGQDTQSRQQAEVDHIVLDDFGIDGDGHLLVVVDLLGGSLVLGLDRPRVVRTVGVVAEVGPEVFVGDVVVLLVGHVYSGDDGDHL